MSRRFLTKLKQALTPIQDQWVLTGLDGEVYEEVTVERLNADSVTFSHRVGRTRLPLASLTDDSRLRILRGFEMTPGEELESIEAPRPSAVQIDQPAKA